MRLVLVQFIFFPIVAVLGLNNLISDPGFEIIGQVLPDSYISTPPPLQPFQYRIVMNNETNWYSLVSGGMVIRQKVDLDTIVMDTLNFNYYEKICQNFGFVGEHPYELSFDYLIDNNVYSALMSVQFNQEQLFYRKIMQNYTQRITYTVYLNQSVNILCFEGYNVESAPIGVLIDNLTLAPYDIHYVQFIAQPIIGKTNQIALISNETVVNSAQLQIFATQIDINITGVSYQILNTYANQNNKLVFVIEIYQQYGSSATQIQINLPIHRNLDGALIMYFVSADKLPRYLYEDQSVKEIVTQSRFSLLLLAKIYNVCFRVIKIVGFSFIGLRFLSFFYLFLFLGFLNIEFILPSVRVLLGEIVRLTINSQTFGFFMQIAGKDVYRFGAEKIHLGEVMDNWNSAGLHYSDYDISTNLYALLIDNLIIALFNTGKLFLFIYVIFKGRGSIIRILNSIKQSKIFLEYVTILPVVVLAVAVCWSEVIGIINYSGKFNRGFMVILAFTSLFLCLAILVRDKSSLRQNFIKHVKKYRYHSEQRMKTKKYYQMMIILGFLQNILFVVIPILVGIGCVYLALIIVILVVIGKMSCSVQAFRKKPNFLQFMWTITIFLEFCQVVGFMIAEIIHDIPSMEAHSEINAMEFLSYLSIALLYVYIIGGFFEIVLCVYIFVRGFRLLGFVWEAIISRLSKELKKDNEIEVGQNVLQQGYKNEDTSNSLKPINSVKEKMQTESNASQEKMSNPFIKSKNDIEKGAKNNETKNQAKTIEKGKNRIINRMNIELTEQGLKQKQSNVKFDIQQNPPNTASVVKKSRAIPIKTQQKKQSLDQKTSKFSKHTQVLPKIVEVSQGPQTNKDIGMTNFDKQQNFT